MPCNEEIDARIKKIVGAWENTSSRKMFGGVCHLLNGNMMGGVNGDYMILRLGQKRAERSLSLPHVRPFDMTGKPMKDWIMVEKKGFETDEELTAWLEKAKQFTEALPPKKGAG